MATFWQRLLSLEPSFAIVLGIISTVEMWTCVVTASTGERVPLHCIARHPTQPHIVATGGQDGALSLWDLRLERYPVTLLSAHSADSMYPVVPGSYSA